MTFIDKDGKKVAKSEEAGQKKCSDGGRGFSCTSLFHFHSSSFFLFFFLLFESGSVFYSFERRLLGRGCRSGCHFRETSHSAGGRFGIPETLGYLGTVATLHLGLMRLHVDNWDCRAHKWSTRSIYETCC